MNGLGNEFFAGTAFALDEHSGAAGSDLADKIKNPQHGSALELLVLFFSAATGDRSADIRQQLLIIPGFLDEIGGAVLNGADGVINRAVSGDHDDCKLGIAAANIGQNFQAVAVRQCEIE